MSPTFCKFSPENRATNHRRPRRQPFLGSCPLTTTFVYSVFTRIDLVDVTDTYCRLSVESPSPGATRGKCFDSILGDVFRANAVPGKASRPTADPVDEGQPNET